MTSNQKNLDLLHHDSEIRQRSMMRLTDLCDYLRLKSMREVLYCAEVLQDEREIKNEEIRDALEAIGIADKLSAKITELRHYLDLVSNQKNIDRRLNR